MYRLSEENIKKMDKYSGETSNELMIYLRRNFPITKLKHDWMENPIIFITIDGKSKLLTGNKKFLVNQISSILENGWSHLSTKELRRTIKKYLDLGLLS